MVKWIYWLLIPDGRWHYFYYYSHLQVMVMKLCLTKQSKEIGYLFLHGNLQDFKYFFYSKMFLPVFFLHCADLGVQAPGFCFFKAPSDMSYCKRCYTNKIELNWIFFWGGGLFWVEIWVDLKYFLLLKSWFFFQKGLTNETCCISTFLRQKSHLSWGTMPWTAHPSLLMSVSLASSTTEKEVC